MAGTRRDFNLDELLGERYVKHYLRFIDGAGSKFYVAPDPDMPGEYTRYSYRVAEDDEQIERRGSGPDTCSSSFGLATLPGFVWDVCGYYRRLGVDPSATRRQLRLAYLHHGGLDDQRMTYALTQLLNPAVRRAYDLASPLVPFLLDQETNERLKAAAAREAARRTARAGHMVDTDAVLGDWGYRQRATREDAMPSYGRARDEDEALPGLPLGASLDPWGMQWSWYVLDDPELASGLHPGWLAAWQRELRLELHNRGYQVSFAVGVMGDASFFRIWRMTDGVCIVFLSREQEPVPGLARKAVDQMITLSGVPRHGHAQRFRSI
jgi:hypothetical protein